MTVALVDDEKNVRLAVRTALKKEGFDVAEYANGQDAFDSFRNREIPSIYLLDILMPVMDGISFLRKLREAGSDVPVMFLTSRDEEFDKVLGLELGADDYLCKPFSVRELIARIHVILRRSGAQRSCCASDVISRGAVSLNMLSYTAEVKGQPVSLTVTEFRLLQAFLSHPGEVLSREQLIGICYPEDTYLNDRAIDCHVKRLRKKLGNFSSLENCIETVYGLGYKWTS